MAATATRNLDGDPCCEAHYRRELNGEPASDAHKIMVHLKTVTQPVVNGTLCRRGCGLPMHRGRCKKQQQSASNQTAGSLGIQAPPAKPDSPWSVMKVDRLEYFNVTRASNKPVDPMFERLAAQVRRELAVDDMATMLLKVNPPKGVKPYNFRATLMRNFAAEKLCVYVFASTKLGHVAIGRYVDSKGRVLPLNGVAPQPECRKK